MKKLLTVILVLTFAFSLFGCAPDTPDVPEKPQNNGEPVGIEGEAENTADYNLNPVGMLPEVLHFEIPARGENSPIDISVEYGLNGRLIGAEAVSGDINVVGILSDTEIILEDIWFTHQLYRLDIETKEAEPLLSEEVYGHTYDEYYDSVTKKWTWLEWCAQPTLNGSRRETEKPMIAYYSNKYAEDGVMTNEENCWDYGAIWIIDIDTGEETRIPSPDGMQISGGSGVAWFGTRDINFTTSVDGIDNYAKYNTETGEYTFAELNYDDICAFIDEDREFSKFLRFGTDGIDLSDSIEGEYGTFYRVTDERFDTPEELEEYIHSLYSEEYLFNYIYDRIIISDGKVYRRESDMEYECSGGYRFDIRMIGDDQIRVDAFMLLQGELDFSLRAGYIFMKGDDGWKIDWVDRNRLVTDGWYVVGDFSDVPMTAEEISTLLKKDLYMWARTNTWVFESEWSMQFDDGDSVNCIEKEVQDWTMIYYKVTDPEFDTWDKWEALVRSVYTGEKLDKMLSDYTYTDIDGALYTTGDADRGYYEDIGNYAWCVIEYTDDSVTIVKRFGDISENCETIYSEEYVFVNTPDGWRISSVLRL